MILQRTFDRNVLHCTKLMDFFLPCITVVPDDFLAAVVHTDN